MIKEVPVRISHFFMIAGYGLIVVHTEKLAPLSHIHTTLYLKQAFPVFQLASADVHTHTEGQLKELSHEIVFKNVDKNLQNLA